MKRFATIAALTLAMTAAHPAAAQDFGNVMGMFSTAEEGFGQSLGQSMVGGQSVFVYAQGRAKLAEPLPEAYTVEVSEKAPTAVEAIRLRDARLEKLKAVAQKFTVPFEVSDEAVSLGGDTPGGLAMVLAPHAKSAAPEDGEAKPEFVAKATLRLGKPADTSGTFLDALHSAGADNISSSDAGASLLSRRAADLLGNGPSSRVDSKVWDEAVADAIRQARAQANSLAVSAGRNLGEARQILFLMRSADGEYAVVTVAVRFGFTGKP